MGWIQAFKIILYHQFILYTTLFLWTLLFFSLCSQAVAGDEAHTLSVVSQALASRRENLLQTLGRMWFVNKFWCLFWGNWYKTQSWQFWSDFSILLKTQSMVVYSSWCGYQITPLIPLLSTQPQFNCFDN